MWDKQGTNKEMLQSSFENENSLGGGGGRGIIIGGSPPGNKWKSKQGDGDSV